MKTKEFATLNGDDAVYLIYLSGYRMSELFN
jgi:hypothetical protein